MAHCILIADSGSTKTDWVLISEKYGMLELHSAGINPVRDSQHTIFNILQEQLLPNLPKNINVSNIFFYGAGCIDPFRKSVIDPLRSFFTSADIQVESDLLGAARALCGNETGLACILGTGTNSCLYDGTRITQNVPPLGYILGDEGSGATLGKTLAGNILKGIFPVYLQETFYQQFNLGISDIIDRVYRQPQANTFLASFVPFITEHRQITEVHDMLVQSFCLFFQRNIIPYHHPEMPVNFVGSIAYIFQPELNKAAKITGFTIGKIIQRPIHSLVKFHT